MTSRRVLPIYLIVGGVCAATHNSVLILVDAAGGNPAVGLALSYCIVTILGFTLHSRYTFARRGNILAFLRYALAMTFSLPGSAVLLWIFVIELCWPMALAAPLATVIMIAINYLSSRWALVLAGTRRSPGYSL